MRRPGSLSSGCLPQRFEHRAGRVVGDVPVAGKLMRERAHVAGALHVVLAAQRINADARPADIAGRHGEIGDRHHGGRALAVLGDAETVIDRAVAAGGVEPRRGADRFRRHAGNLRHFFRAVARLGDESGPVAELVPVAALVHEFLVDQSLGDDDMRQRRENGDIGARPKRQVIGGFHMRRAHEIDAARIDHDQLRSGPQPLLHARSEHRMRIGRIGADQDDDVGMLD